MLTKDELLAAFRTAVAARDPEKVVREFMPRIQGSPSNWPKRKFGIAVGKAAMAMARGFGPVERGGSFRVRSPFPTSAASPRRAWRAR
jgi:glycerate-2-kinase